MDMAVLSLVYAAVCIQVSAYYQSLSNNILSQGRVHGVAKKANVISLKALDQGGSGRLSNILLALHWIVKRHIANPGAKSIVK
jgi:hypothetical protein